MYVETLTVLDKIVGLLLYPTSVIFKAETVINRVTDDNLTLRGIAQYFEIFVWLNFIYH